MKSLHIDIETFSEADLPKTGVYRYAEDPSFEVLLFGVAVDDGPVEVYDLKCGETIPKEILDALLDNSVTKWAFNAQFEIITHVVNSEIIGQFNVIKGQGVCRLVIRRAGNRLVVNNHRT